LNQKKKNVFDKFFVSHLMHQAFRERFAYNSVDFRYKKIDYAFNSLKTENILGSFSLFFFFT